MNKKLRFIWIDDENREVSFQNMKAQLGIIGKFINITQANVDYLTDINKIKPDLILIDHNLTKSNDKIKKGSTIASLIREKHPDIAIACVTGQLMNKPIDTLEQSSYETVFNIDEIEKNYETMKSIANSYRKLIAGKPNNTTEFIALLNAPKVDKIKLEYIVPREIKDNFNDKALFKNTSHWIRNILIERPGFLYNRLWAATYLGLTERGFEKVEEIFKTAKYNGLFADKTKERWWKSKLLEILSKEVKTTGLPWQKGRSLKGINAHNFSKDHYTNNNEDLPEVVAYTDETSREQYPMKLKYTVPHPRFDKLLFFEEIRMMKLD
ncbi:MAG: hypothetical protein ABI851_16415 [Saprospiraceae bacterium]